MQRTALPLLREVRCRFLFRSFASGLAAVCVVGLGAVLVPGAGLVGYALAQKPGETVPPPASPRPSVVPTPSAVPAPPAPVDADQVRLRALACPNPATAAPVPTKEVEEEYGQYVERRINPRNTLDLIIGQTTVLVLKQAPRRVQFPDEKIVGSEPRDGLLSPKEISLTGKQVGDSVLILWFADVKDPKKETILSYRVRVRRPTTTRDLERQQKQDMERRYCALQDEINHAFPDSVIRLTLVGDRLVLSGQAKDRPEAEAVFRLVQANAPGRRRTLSGPGTNANVNINLTGADLAEDGLPPRALERTLNTGAPNIVNLLTIPGEQQVLLRVSVAEVNRTAARSIGVNFMISSRAGSFSQLTGNIAGGTASGGGGGGTNSSAGAITTAASSLDNLPTVLDFGRITAAINALRTLDFARSLAEPTLVAMHGQTASFQAGGTFPVPVLTGTGLTVAQGVQFVPFGVQVTFTPIITDKDRIRLQVNANVSTRNVQTGTTIGNSSVSGTNTRNFQTIVEMREGQTLAVAGLIQNDFDDSARVPLFGDLPFIGRFFAFDHTTAGEQELVITVTPTLVHPLEKKECPPLPGADLFEPGDIEFYLLGRLESLRPYNYRSTVMNNMARMARYRHCEEVFIFGPQGHSPCKP